MDLALDLRMQAAKQAVSIFQVLEVIGTALPSGHVTQQVLCPFHADRHPSARVYDDHLFCFTCGKNWDAVAVIQDHYRIGFADAVAWVESNFHLPPVSVDLTATLKATLQAKPALRVEELYAYTEARLIGVRARCTMARYIRLSYALDLLTYQLQEHKITAEAFAAGCRKLLTVIEQY